METSAQIALDESSKQIARLVTSNVSKEKRQIAHVSTNTTQCTTISVLIPTIEGSFENNIAFNQGV